MNAEYAHATQSSQNSEYTLGGAKLLLEHIEGVRHDLAHGDAEWPQSE